MRGFVKWLIQLVVALVAILLVSGMNVLIRGSQRGEFAWQEYIDTLKSVIERVFPIQDFYVEVFLGRQGIVQIPFFPKIYEYIEYSLQLLFLAMIFSIIVALTATIGTMLLSEKARSRVKIVSYFFESLPDILIILLAQITVVLIYKQTGHLVSKIAVLGDERIYWLPILCLMILPTIQLYRLSMLTFEAEERAMYVELARSLGFTKTFVLLRHVFRNAIISVFFQSKKTMWFMLSNLFVLELMFNIPGIMYFLSERLSSELFFVTILSFFLPVFFLYSFGEWYFIRRINRGGARG
ncbi:ABC transporter permease subunit [Paenisporosarcina cavernae]|uniref:ABC transporter permease subunit n=1 Tax=Paenisporosarcina cavernae TaxID=2320858 RepID=A0A385YSV9_9BACL|nr:ABC transporter permease subunit [Paenisporosarcina cavernae]AYC28768.1 ABC transporter permease subunit [Paenisporosarcina cavernae]